MENGRVKANTKIARTILSEILDSIGTLDNIEIALRMYGHTKHFPPQNCNDTRLEVPFGKIILKK